MLLEDDDVSEIFPGPFDLCPILVTSLFDVESLKVLLEDDEILGDGERLEYVSEIFPGSFDVSSILSFSLFDVESLDELLEDDALRRPLYGKPLTNPFRCSIQILDQRNFY